MRYLHLIGLLLLTGCYSAADTAGPEPLDDPDDPLQPSDDDDDTATDDDDTTAPLDAAAIVSVLLPTELECGETFEAWVEVRNTGWGTWAREWGYKLGTVGDEDALHDGTRVWLPDTALVAPDETWVFSFELVAPNAAGTHVTDWQMVHEGVQWFGETTSSSVDVSCGEQVVTDPLTSRSPVAT